MFLCKCVSLFLLSHLKCYFWLFSSTAVPRMSSLENISLNESACLFFPEHYLSYWSLRQWEAFPHEKIGTEKKQRVYRVPGSSSMLPWGLTVLHPLGL